MFSVGIGEDSYHRTAPKKAINEACNLANLLARQMTKQDWLSAAVKR